MNAPLKTYPTAPVGLTRAQLDTYATTCSCGREPDPSESPTSGLYIDDGTLAYICLPCWQGVALDMPPPN